MITIVIPLHHKGGKLKDDSELRFALRSIAANFNEDSYQVAIVGRKLPVWVQNVTFIQQHSAGLKTALKMAAEAFPAGFFWFYDDTCILRLITAEQMKVTPCSRGWSNPRTSWARKLDAIRQRLEADGRKAWDYSRPHGPYWFDKGMIDEAFRDWPGMDGKLPFESWILSKRDWPRRHSGYKQYYGPFRGAPGDHQQFLNYNNKGFTPELRDWLRDRFPEPCPFERPIPVAISRTDLTGNERIRASVIHLPARPRWEGQCVADMAEVGIDVELFAGVDGHAGEQTVMPLNRPAFKKDFKREPLPGEIGCYASHIQFARAFDTTPPLAPEFPGWRLVLEDDAVSVGIDAVTVRQIAALADFNGFDVVMLHTGRENSRGYGDLKLTQTTGRDVFTHAYLVNAKACREMTGWEMRHPIDIAIVRAKNFRVGVLWGGARFDQRDPLASASSIHRERAGLPNQTALADMTITDAFIGFSSPDHRIACNKLARHGYGPMYEKLLTPLRGKSAALLEIGVCTGASLHGFRKFLGQAADITGLDIDLSHIKFPGEKVLQLDARQPTTAELFADESLDFLIDDGSHKIDDQRAAFDLFWRKIKPGGHFVIEDISNAFAFAVRFSDHPFTWWDSRDHAEKHAWSLCAVFTNPNELNPRPGPSVDAYTLRWGDAAWIAPCADSLEQWAKRHSITLKVWGKPEDGKYPTPKFVVVEMLRDFLQDSTADYMLYFDADVFVHPDAPPFPLCPGFMAMTDRAHRNWNGDWQSWCVQHFGIRPEGFHYRNAGLWSCDRKAAAELLQVASGPFIERVQDQHQFNWWIYQATRNGMRLQDLHPTWNRDSGALKPAWMFHLWGAGNKTEKLERVRRRGLIGDSDGLMVADCAWQKRRGLGNRITLLCDSYARAKTRGMEFAFTWTARKHCGANWTDLFKPLEGIEQIDSIPSGADIRRDDAYYTDKTESRSPEFWEAWREMARMIQLAECLDLPEAEPFDAISLRLTHPRGAYNNRWAAMLPRVVRPFVSSDCQQGLQWALEAFPDAWHLSPKLYNIDDARRNIDHMRGAARDMMMLTKARCIVAVGRESTFRNLAHIGYQVPVLRFHEGTAP